MCAERRVGRSKNPLALAAGCAMCLALAISFLATKFHCQKKKVEAFWHASSKTKDLSSQNCPTKYKLPLHYFCTSRGKVYTYFNNNIHRLIYCSQTLLRFPGPTLGLWRLRSRKGEGRETNCSSLLLLLLLISICNFTYSTKFWSITRSARREGQGNKSVSIKSCHFIPKLAVVIKPVTLTNVQKYWTHDCFLSIRR